MPEGNGDHVTWRELNLIRAFIDERFDRLEELLLDKKTSRRAWWPPIVAGVIAAVISLPLALFH